MKHKELFFIAVSTHFVFKKKHFSSSEKEVKRQSKFLQINVMNRLLSGCKDLQSLCKSPQVFSLNAYFDCYDDFKTSVHAINKKFK